MKLEILYKDEDIIVVNKPPGIAVIPDRFKKELPSINLMLSQQIGQKVFTVHRLDKDTSGVLCFALNSNAHQQLSNQFQNHSIKKAYLALINGVILPESQMIDLPIDKHPTISGKMIVKKNGKPSTTSYTTLKKWAMYSYLELQLHTGRTHQIRVHLSYLGHPIVADNLYGNGQPFKLSTIKKNYKQSQKDDIEKPLLSRLALHAYKLNFINLQEQVIQVEAEIPKDMTACIKQLDKHHI